MTTQKRRVIYMTDQEWAFIQEVAGLRGMSASALIREQAAPPHPLPSSARNEVQSQAERDAILRRINK